MPEEYRGEFSYASEHVTSGSAIAALLSVKEAMTTYNERFGGDWSGQLKWIDQRLGELWNEVIDEHSVSLLCTYALQNMDEHLPKALIELHSRNITAGHGGS